MFEDAKAKLDRADKHIEELEKEFTKFSKENPGALVSHTDKSTFVLKPENAPMPAALAATLGDAVNNLRTSLDLMAYRLADDGAKSKFPFSKTKENFPQELKKSGISDQGVRDYIEHAVMPYKGGDNDIWALHDTDIISKHHTLIPTSNSTSMSNVSFKAGGVTVHGGFFGGPGNVPLVVSDAPISVINPGRPHATMYFTASSGFGQVPILSKLRELAKKLRGIVADVEKLMS